MPANLRLTLHIGIGKCQITHLHIDGWICLRCAFADRPAHIGGQLFQRNIGIFKNTRKL